MTTSPNAAASSGVPADEREPSVSTSGCSCSGCRDAKPHFVSGLDPQLRERRADHARADDTDAHRSLIGEVDR